MLDCDCDTPYFGLRPCLCSSRAKHKVHLHRDLAVFHRHSHILEEQGHVRGTKLHAHDPGQWMHNVSGENLPELSPTVDMLFRAESMRVNVIMNTQISIA